MIATLFAIDLGCSVAAVAVYWMTVAATARLGARDRPSARWLGRLAYTAAAAGFVLILAGLIRSRPHPTGPDELLVGGARHVLWLLLYVWCCCSLRSSMRWRWSPPGPLPSESDRSRTWH